MDIFKIIIAKGLENDKMRGVMHSLWIENEKLKIKIAEYTEKFPPREVKDIEGLDALEEDVIKIKRNDYLMLRKLYYMNKVVI